MRHARHLVTPGEPHATAGTAPGESHAVSFPLLDTLRAVGSLAVLTTHVGFESASYGLGGVRGTLLSRLDVGVALFFVLSGFLLSRGWLSSSLDGRTRPGTGRYLWKRLLRIAPIYLLTAVLALTFIGANADASPGTWVRSLLLLDTFSDHPPTTGLTHMWSLAVEVSFYLALPLLMWAALGRRFRPRRLAAALLAMLAVTCWWHLRGAGWAGEATSGSQLQWLPGYLSWFAVGIGLAAVREMRVRGRARRFTDAAAALGGHPGVCWAIAAGLLLIAATPLAGPSSLLAPTPAESLTKSLLYGVIGGLVVLTGVFPSSGSGYARWFGGSFARHLGVISYGIFALHMPVIYLVMHLMGWQLFVVDFLPLWLLTIAVSVVVAEAAYRLVELPALRLRNLSPRRPGSSPERVDEASTSTATTGASAR